MKLTDSLRLIARNMQSRVEALAYDQSSWLFPPDFDEDVVNTIRTVQPYTMTPTRRVFALCNAVEYITENRVPGDIVECGVWRGGSMMAAALTLLRLGDTSRHLYLFDTFEGMTKPGEVDISCGGTKAWEIWKKRGGNGDGSNWCIASLQEVRRNMSSIGYPNDLIHLVQGKVESTLPDKAPQSIALLRLDTDWYESTYHEMIHLYPRLSTGGVIIIDDYGYWLGARKAVDEYLQENGVPLLLNRIDNSARIGVKTQSLGLYDDR